MYNLGTGKICGNKQSTGFFNEAEKQDYESAELK
jgi:hypothetical protein